MNDWLLPLLALATSMLTAITGIGARLVDLADAGGQMDLFGN